MTADIFQKSLRDWGVRHCLSSAYNSHSNCRSELTVKVDKKLLSDNVGPGGSWQLPFKTKQATIPPSGTRQVLIRVDGSRMVTMRNRRYVRQRDPELRKVPKPAPVRRKPVGHSPVRYDQVHKVSAVGHDQVPEVQAEGLHPVKVRDPPNPQIEDVRQGDQGAADVHVDEHTGHEDVLDQIAQEEMMIKDAEPHEG